MDGTNKGAPREHAGGSKGRPMLRPILLLMIIVVVLICAHVFGLGRRLGLLRDWIDGLDPWGPIVFVFLYALATMAAIPGSALTVVAGALFGSVLGVLSVSMASTLGAALCFLISRYVARDAVAQWLAKSEKFARLDKMTEDHGAIVVALTRLVPIFPYNLLNYGFGLTRVRFWTYVFWSWLCMLPGTVLYVVGADAVFKGLSQGKIPWPLIAVAAGTIVFLVIVVKVARGRLQAEQTGEGSRRE